MCRLVRLSATAEASSIARNDRTEPPALVGPAAEPERHARGALAHDSAHRSRQIESSLFVKQFFGQPARSIVWSGVVCLWLLS